MQYENENMDELFRRAAEDYPLDTSSKDWSKVQQALENNQNETPVAQRNNKGRFLWLLLLLPMGLLCNKYVMNGGEGNNRIAGKQQHETSSSKTPDAAVENKQPVNSSTKNNTVATNQTSSELTPSGETSKEKPRGKNGIVAIAQTNKQGSDKTTASSYNRQKSKTRKEDVVSDDLSTEGPMVPPNSYIEGRAAQNIFSSRPLWVFPASEMQAREGALPKAKSSDKRFYVGLIGGMDLTTIKFQKVEDVGYDAGILLGYDLNKKLSIESGFFLDKKIYYTKGEHFNTSKVYLPPATWINEVSGYCKMFEVPLTLRYTISSTPKKSWFVTAGASSYLMREENYTYLYENSVAQWPKAKQYQNSDNYFFSVIQMSGGFTHKIGKVGDLRIEPYLKLPLAGMGVGELPFLSTGLHVGITRKLF
jgi:hypothetical protein